jgi:hypothetical protein
LLLPAIASGTGVYRRTSRCFADRVLPAAFARIHGRIRTGRDAAAFPDIAGSYATL